jgi:Tfp pilus assembly protein PilX
MTSGRLFPHSPGRQDGVVLITSLILLVIMTLLAVSMLRTSIVELRIGGSGQIGARNLSNAESAIESYINRINYPGGGAVPDWIAASAPTAATSYGALESVQITLPVSENSCTQDPDSQKNGIVKVLYRDIRAEASSVLGGSVVLHQGVSMRVASCN